MVAQTTLASLPDIEMLRRLSQSLAVLESIMCSRRDFRYYTFDSSWGQGEMMASMGDGSGNDYFILFNAAGAIIKGFDHESEMSPYAGDEMKVWPGVLDEVPPEFADFLSEPAFTIEDSTFCIWRRYTDPAWRVGTIHYPEGDEDADGSGWMLSILGGGPEEYHEFAESYYERPVDLEAVKHIYDSEPLTEDIVKGLNTARSLGDLRKDIEEIGYTGGAT